MTRKQKKLLARILIGAVIWLAGRIFLPEEMILWQGIVFGVCYLLVGYDILWKAIRNIARRQIFDENFLMAVASLGAFGAGEFPEAAAVMLLDQVGELFESYAVGKSRKSVTELMDLRPDYANVLVDGNLTQVDPDILAVGDSILVKPGEKVPLDGVITQGSSTLDTAALTGESMPRACGVGDPVLSGMVNLSGALTVQVEKTYGESTAAKILDLVENAASRKTKTENFITKFARYYTPIVCACALALAALPPLTMGLLTGTWDFWTWVYRALIFLVVSCPCALVISVPLTFFSGIGAASRAGVLLKGSNYFEELSRVSVAVFDKTGTLTKGSFSVTAKVPAPDATEEELLEAAAYAEAFSNHPIAQSVRKAYGLLEEERVTSGQEAAGRGVGALLDGVPVLAGNAQLMTDAKLTPAAVTHPGTVVHVAKGNRYLGYLCIADEIKPDAAAAIAGLKARGVKTVMLTGDHPAAAQAVGDAVGVEEIHAGLLPGDKVEQVEALLAETGKGSLLFVGDGINDAPVLSRADVGIAMGGVGSDAATEAADVVIMQDQPSKVATAMDIARLATRIARQNIVLALGIKLLVLVLSAVGLGTMWMAIFADVGVCVLAVLNALRVLRFREKPIQ